MELVTEGLFDAPDGADQTKSVGFEIGVAGPLEVQVKAAIEQAADPRASDGGYASWTARIPHRLDADTTIGVEGSGTLSATDGYSQGVAATIRWTPRETVPFLSALQLENDLVVNPHAGTVELTAAPEWVVSSRDVQASGGMRSELKARMEMKSAFDGAPSAYAGFSLEIGPE